VNHANIAGVAFTGSTETAQIINRALAAKSGPIVPFIAETGGQNAMIVDSSALPEQVVSDVLTSSFQSAGQRCSALRVLYVQSDIADRVIDMLRGAMTALVVGDPANLHTDVGPVIDQTALSLLQNHYQRMQSEAIHIATSTLASESADKPGNNGTYFAPTAFEIKSIKQLEREVFGPFLHIVRFNASELDQIIDDINGTGFGLTLGIHSRIDLTVQHIYDRARVGNVYVNRNQIGAIVGVQPFGGMGLSGTGPKAGGPDYVPRFTCERALSINTTAQGGNTDLVTLQDSSIE
jgi:RHH-type proline utilization regulon transcriptional repressor/proline dehydrogenase/delta 1-pyrroline-5-carboxylate dehydrogenase